MVNVQRKYGFYMLTASFKLNSFNEYYSVFRLKIRKANNISLTLKIRKANNFSLKIYVLLVMT